MIKIIKKILGIINSIVLCFRFPFLYPRSGRPATKISTGYISPYCDDCYQQYYKDKPYSVIKNWYGWTGSNIENKQVVS